MKSLFFLVALFVFTQARGLPISGIWDEWEHDAPTFAKRICEYDYLGFKYERCCNGWQNFETGCHTPVCTAPCENGGLCIAPDTCECPPGLSGPTCTEFDENEYCWTMWNSLDEPSTGLGDFEHIVQHREKTKICQGSNPIAIDCRTTGGISWFSVAQEVTCDLQRGFICEHSQQKSSTCEDYEVRFLCPCGSKDKTESKDNKETKEEVTKPEILIPKVENKTCSIGNTSISSGMNMSFGCRTCDCTIEGTWLCTTNATCMMNETYTPGICKVNATTILLETDITTFDCNVCVCTKSGNLECTKMICPAKNSALQLPILSRCYDNDGMSYEEHTLKRKDCNVCICTQGKWDCTRLECTQDIYEAQMEQFVCTTFDGKTYRHGATFIKDCNAWTCYKGIWASTRRYCSPISYPNTKCMDTNTSSILSNGQIIRRGCNVCVCNSGNLTCTTEKCPMEITGVCFRDLNHYLFNNMTDVKLYKPVCNSTNGLYEPVQCKGKKCFCVDPFGRYMPKSYTYGKSPNCSAYFYNMTMPPMTNETEMMSYQKPLIYNRYVNLTCNQVLLKSLMNPFMSRPVCMPDGSFAPTQCYPETEMCYCVYSNGTYINGTKTHISKGMPFCRQMRPENETTYTELSRCNIRSNMFEKLNLPYKPTCADDGSFNPRQCNLITGVCFCVDYLGDIIPDTITNHADLQTPNCEIYWTEKWRKMKMERILPSRVFSNIIDNEKFPERMPICHRQLEISRTMKTIYMPTCRTDGTFEPLQCPSGSRVCFCVDITGVIVANTTSSKITPPNCDMYHNVSQLSWPIRSPIDCGENCPLVQTLTLPRIETIEQPTEISERINFTLSPCAQQQIIANTVPGVFKPTCNFDGTFSPLQCQPQSGICYCVDTNGVRIPTTEAKVYKEGLPSCEQYLNVTLDVVTNMTSVYPEELQMVNVMTPDTVNISSLMNFTNSKFNFTSLFNQTTLSMLNQSSWNMTLHKLMFNSSQWYTNLYNDTALSTLMNTTIWNTTIFDTVFNASVWNETDFNTLFNVTQWNTTLYTVMFNTSLWNTTFFDTLFNVTQWNTTTSLWLLNITAPEDCKNVSKYYNRTVKDCFENQRLASLNPEMVAPICNPNNTYSSLQCNRKTGYCYCSYLNGIMIPETVTPIIEGTPSCWQYSTVNITNMTLNEEKMSNWTKKSWTVANRAIIWNMTLNYLQKINETLTMPEQTCFIGNVSIQSGTNATFGCRVCECNNGIWNCTFSESCLLNETFTPGVCEVNSTTILLEQDITTVDCNVCVCARNNSLVCTNMFCPTVKVVPRRCFDVRSTKFYDHNAVLRRDCNVCLCSQGLWDCTDERCPFVSSNKVCTDGFGGTHPNGATLVKDCNAWTCIDGKWAGTRSYCSPLTYPLSSCLDLNTSTTLYNGQTFKRGCNICVCNSGNIVCTSVECPTNSNGICLDHLNHHIYRNSRPIGCAPKCNATNGLYQPVQCNNITKMCYCVSPFGRFMPGTIVYNKTPNCSAYIYNSTRPKLNFSEVVGTTTPKPTDRDCSNHTCRQMLLISFFNPRVERPTCLADGSYAPVQCNVYGYCYCVERNGTYINGTMTHISKGRPICLKFRETLEIVIEEETETPINTGCVLMAKVAKEMMLPHIPTCTPRGGYTPLQCNTMTGLCFCVDVQGTIIPDTTVLVSEISRLDCHQYRTQEYSKNLTHLQEPIISDIINNEKFPAEMPLCERQKIIARDLKTVFMPTCEYNGIYSPLQCPTGTDVCFCVDRTGSVIVNTTTTTMNSSPDMCEMYRDVSLIPFEMVNTTVYDTFPYFCGSDCPKVGPQFDRRMNYSLPNITNINYPPCVQQLVIASIVPGVFRPTCQKNLTFSPLQCQPQSGICYCVDTLGVTIQGTQHKVSQDGLPDCSMYWNTTLPVNTNLTTFMVEEMQAMNEMNLETVNVTELFNLTSVFNASTPFNISRWNATLLNITGVNTTLIGTKKLSWPVKTDCFKMQALHSRKPGMFVPTCNRDNTYAALQCSRETGVCFCSVPNGYYITLTATPIIEGTPSCWQYAQAINITQLNIERSELLRNALTNWTATLNNTITEETPKEVENDNTELDTPRRLYDPLYCSTVGSFRVYCYCTWPSGMEVKGTRTYFTVPDCSHIPDMCKARDEFYNPGEKIIKNVMTEGTGSNVRITGCQSCTCTAGSWKCEYTTECEGYITSPPKPPTTASPMIEKESQKILSTKSLEPHVCEHEGISYESGQVHSWDCRTCTCVNYRWVCSTRNCDATTIAPTNIPIVTTIGYRDCTIGDLVFSHSSSFNIGCTECTCTDGDAFCSSRNCQ